MRNRLTFGVSQHLDNKHHGDYQPRIRSSAENFSTEYSSSTTPPPSDDQGRNRKDVVSSKEDQERIERELARGVWMTQEMLCKRLNIPVSRVDQALRVLEKNGVVRKANQKDIIPEITPDRQETYWTVIPRRHGIYEIELKSEDGEDIVAFVSARLDANQVKHLQDIQNELRKMRKKNARTEEKPDPSKQ